MYLKISMALFIKNKATRKKIDNVRFSVKGFPILADTLFADLTVSDIPALSNPFSRIVLGSHTFQLSNVHARFSNQTSSMEPHHNLLLIRSP